MQYGHESSPTSRSLTTASYSPPQVGHSHVARIHDVGKISSADCSFLSDHSKDSSGLTAFNELNPGKTFLPAQYGQASSPTSRSLTAASYSPPQIGHSHVARIHDVGSILSADVQFLSDHSEDNSGLTAFNELNPGKTFFPAQYGHESSPTLRSLTTASYSPPQVGHSHVARIPDVGKISSADIQFLSDHSKNNSGLTAFNELNPGKTFLPAQYGHESSPTSRSFILAIYSPLHLGHFHIP